MIYHHHGYTFPLPTPLMLVAAAVGVGLYFDGYSAWWLLLAMPATGGLLGLLLNVAALCTEPVLIRHFSSRGKQP